MQAQQVMQTQQELNAKVCYCGHRHDQHGYDATTNNSPCNYTYKTRAGIHRCPCAHCSHPVQP